MSNQEIAAAVNEIYNGFWIRWKDRKNSERDFDQIYQESKRLLEKYKFKLAQDMVLDLLDELGRRNMGKRYVRFMGIEEIRKYLRGEKLENHRKWIWGSVGFCFFDMAVRPEERIEYLTGNVTMEIVAEFERIDKTPMREAMGQYRDPKGGFFTLPIPRMKVKEYSVEEYNQDTMRLVRVGYVADSWNRKIAWMEEAE